MALFEPQYETQSSQARHVFALYEIAHTLVDFFAAVFFIIGSIMFFYENLQTAGTWLFLIGSILFATKPTLRLMRELKLLGMGRDAAIVAQADDKGDSL
ncbi:YrhK family protein [Pacificibacter sp. AS14]|uniref:YrhK family protein n=1 Tax=Pacificibacter sp. AS14 TaxID=3135785 RepID=UPI00317248AD